MQHTVSQLTARTHPLFIAVLLATFLCVPADTWAKEVYLNGVQITGLTNKNFQNVSVRLDAKGNVYITGKQYQVVKKYAGTTGNKPNVANGNSGTTTTGTSGTTPTKARKFNKDYILVMQRSTKHGSGYKLEITVNGKKVRHIGVHMQQDVFKLNQYLKRGSNTIIIESFKVKRNATGQMTVQLSNGKIKGGKVYVKPPFFLNYKRVSSETNNFRHIFPITIR